MIYLACPYTHNDPKIEAVRANEASIAAGHYLNKGELVFSPLSHSAAILNAAGTRQVGNWGTWMTLDLEILRNCCTRFLILGLFGWLKSVGVQKEITLAMELVIPIRVIRQNTLDIQIPLHRAIIEDGGIEEKAPDNSMDNSLSGSRP